MSRLLFVLIACCALSCADSAQRPTQTDPQAEAVALGDLVEINGSPYRRVAAKPTATKDDYTLTITIPVHITNDGTLGLASTITVGNVVYTANCDGATSDDVGNTIDTATKLTVMPPTRTDQYTWVRSLTYQLTPGDVDYFSLRVPEQCDLAVLSDTDEDKIPIDTAGRLLTRSGRVLDQNDESPTRAPHFTCVVLGISPGTVYLEVKGGTPQATGEYEIWIGTRIPGAGKPVASEVADLERHLALQMRGE